MQYATSFNALHLSWRLWVFPQDEGGGEAWLNSARYRRRFGYRYRWFGARCVLGFFHH